MDSSIMWSMSEMDDVPTPKQIAAMTPGQRKVYENRIRRMADRQLLKLKRSRRRDPRAYDFGQYQLIDSDGNIVAGSRASDIHAFLVKRPE